MYHVLCVGDGGRMPCVIYVIKTRGEISKDVSSVFLLLLSLTECSDFSVST
jgi:hypothetical protein